MNKISALLITTLLYFTVACMDYSQEISVKKDGSGTVSTTIVFNQTIMELISSMGGADSESADKNKFINEIRDRKRLAEDAAKMGVGVEFRDVIPIDNKDGSKGYKAIYSFTDINKLKVTENPKSLNKQDEDKDEKPGGAITFKYAKGKINSLEIHMPQKKKFSNASTPIDSNDEGNKKSKTEEEKKQEDMMKKLFKGFRMEVSVAVEGTITKTNAAFVNSSKNGVTLMMMDVGKLIEDEKYREQLAELSRAQEVAEVKEKLKNIPYMKIEFADIVYVNFN